MIRNSFTRVCFFPAVGAALMPGGRPEGTWGVFAPVGRIDLAFGHLGGVDRVDGGVPAADDLVMLG